jgi:ABC-type branched-subunit amino acid transport system substrate-binding protein
MLLARSMREVTAPTADTMRTALISVKNYAGASGTLSLDGTGNRVGKGVEMKIIRDGKGVILGAT